MQVEIRIDPHTLERAKERGTTEDEIREVIDSGVPVPARHGRKAKGKIYAYQRKRNDRDYEHKRVEVFYIIEGQTIVTVTVYVFYGTWEESDADCL